MTNATGPKAKIENFFWRDYDRLPKPIRLTLVEAALDYAADDALGIYNQILEGLQQQGYGPLAASLAVSEFRRQVERNDEEAVLKPQRELLRNPRSLFLDAPPPRVVASRSGNRRSQKRKHHGKVQSTDRSDWSGSVGLDGQAVR